ncbi:MAG: cytochrome c maturation protein CcmE [Chloroflexi bacterium]|nr:cytochrome c maturation protein CcmE [Chloroflexota bacterium]
MSTANPEQLSLSPQSSVLSTESARSATKRLQFLTCGGVVLLAIAWLTYTTLGTTMVYYVTVPELKTMGAAAQGQPLRVAGLVADQSIRRDSKSSTLEFRIADGPETLPVVYRGIVPDIFADGVEVVVEGRYRPDGVFEAQTLLARCPSKFESELTPDAPASAPAPVAS